MNLMQNLIQQYVSVFEAMFFLNQQYENIISVEQVDSTSYAFSKEHSICFYLQISDEETKILSILFIE